MKTKKAMKIKTKIIFILTVVLFFGLCFNLLDFDFNNEASAAAFPITNCTELQNIQNNLSADYCLVNNIDCSGTVSWNGGAGFEPIGTWSNKFRGSFDGQGHKITNLYINRADECDVGLFKFIDGGEIKNFGLENIDIIGDCRVGGLVGRNKNSTIENIYCIGSSVSGANYSVGGLVGVNESNNTITNSSFTGSMSGGGDNIGGLVGWNKNSTITNSYFTGSLSGNGHFTGGLVGRNIDSTIENSHSIGNVNVVNIIVGGLVGGNYNGIITKSYSTCNLNGGGNYFAGLVGFNQNGIITNSYFTGSINGRNYTGGLIGWNEDNSAITNSYSIGSVNGGTDIGGLVGWNENSTITNSYWDTETSGQLSSDGGVGKTTAEMKKQATFISWDFDDIWNIEENITYPFFLGGGASQCAEESNDCSSMPCCDSPPAPEPLTCVDYTCRSCISLICSANDAKDHSISEMGDAIDDVYCAWNIHDGCLVKEGVATVNGCSGIPSYWEAEICSDCEGGSSDLWGEKKVYIDDINDYNIKARCGVDDSAQVWINGSDANIPFVCCAYGDWADVTSKFITGWNTIKFKAVDTCGDDAWGGCGGRWFDLNWQIIPRAPALNGNASSSSTVDLSWSDRGTGTTYGLWNSDIGAYIYNGDQTSFVHTGLNANTTYSYQVIATKNGYDSDWSNSVSATTWNQLPIADAGSDRFVVIGNSVNLDGSGSNDPDGDPISCDWTFNSIPGASSLTDADFSDETIINPNFTPDTIGVYHIDLTVTDSYGGFSVDTVSITVADPKICGDNNIQCPNSGGLCEICDGTDDALCPGECIAPGEIRECLCPQSMPAWKEVKPKKE